MSYNHLRCQVGGHKPGSRLELRGELPAPSNLTLRGALLQADPGSRFVPIDNVLDRLGMISQVWEFAKR